MSTETSGYESVFGTFFKEQTSLAKGILSAEKVEDSGILIDEKAKFHLPEPASDKQDTEQLKRELSFFYRLGKAKEKSSSFYPAVLHSLKNTGGIMPGDYPFWVADQQSGTDTPAFMPVGQLIDDVIASGITGAEIVAYHKGALLKILWDKLNNNNGYEDATAAFGEAVKSLRETTDISGDEGEAFDAGLSALMEALPSDGTVIGYSSSSLIVLLRLASERTRYASTPLRNDIKGVLNDLEALVLVESEKLPDSHDSKHVKDSFDLAESNIDFEKLAGVIPDAGTESMPENRLNHIKDIIATLQQTEKLLARSPYLVIDKDILKAGEKSWHSQFSKNTIIDFEKGKGCQSAQSIFKKAYQSYAAVMAAYRMGKLELAGHYNNSLHGNYFSSFSWMDFSDEEMAACPPIILIGTTATMMYDELGEYSRLLAANLPIKTVLTDSEQMADFHMNGSSKLNPYRFRQEPGMLSLAHRTVFTAQSTTLTPGALLKAMETGLSHFSPAMIHTIFPGEVSNESYIKQSAAVEGRAFPGFVYEGSLGATWGSRFYIDHNPQSDQDWPSHNLELENEDLETKFTYIDFIALDPRYQALMDEIPPEIWDDDVIPADQFIKMSREGRMGKLPYIWMVDASNTLHRMMPSWPLILLAQERLDFWHYLQEESGIHNFHAEQAVAKQLDQLKQQAAEEINELKAVHEQALADARKEAAEQAMDQLTAMLLDMDASTLVASSGTPAAVPAAKPGTSEEAVEADTGANEEEEEESLSMDDPWIETPLCTSCNECINLNGKLFVYNADKMASIGDPKGGSYAELVKAAESCPVHIIHPGKPLNPDEPGLDDLVKKAEKYN